MYMLKGFLGKLNLIDPDADVREVVKDAHLLADKLRQDATIRRDGVEVRVTYTKGSKFLKSVTPVERK